MNVQAFTLIELLVVITILVVLLALLAPALDKAMDQAERVVCATNQRVIAQGAVQYGLANRKNLFICGGRDQTMAFNGLGVKSGNNYDSDAQVHWPAALASAGLASAEKVPVKTGGIANTPGEPLYENHQPGKMWDCPSRVGWENYYLFLPFGTTRDSTGVLLMGYMYYGGLANWKSPYRWIQRPAPTPEKISDPGDRALTSDVTAKGFGQWGGREEDAWYLKGSAPHKDGAEAYPAGHNQSFLDGSAEWIEANRLHVLHTWNNNAAELFFLWQRDLSGFGYSLGDPNDGFNFAYHKTR